MNFELFHNDDIRVEYCDGTRRDIQRVLDDCREERRPYLVIKNDELRIILIINSVYTLNT